MAERRDTAPEEVLDGDDLRADVELEAPFAADEVTPVVHGCQDCGQDQVVVEREVFLVPETVGEACAIVRCCGTADRDGPRWCRTIFAATWPREGKRTSFDRRKAKR